MHKELQILQNIQKVEASPFLFTRIINSVQNSRRETIPVKWAWTAALCLIVVLSFNIMVIQTNSENFETNLTDSFSLKPQNMLYNE